MNLQLFSKLPMDIIINHILPYTYEPKPKLLLQDIKSYYKDLNIIKNCYYLYSGFMLDKLKSFIIYLLLIHPRHKIFNIKRYQKIIKIANNSLYNCSIKNSIKLNIKRNISKVIGLMNLYERTKFINDYIIYEN